MTLLAKVRLSVLPSDSSEAELAGRVEVYLRSMLAPVEIAMQEALRRKMEEIAEKMRGGKEKCKAPSGIDEP